MREFCCRDSQSDSATVGVMSMISVLVGLLFALSLAVCHVIDANIGQSLPLPCVGDPSRDVEWSFKQNRQKDWLLVAKFHNGNFSAGEDFQKRVKPLHPDNPRNYSLLIDPVVYNDQGVYRCQDGEKALLSENVKIHVPLEFSIQMGKPAKLPCHGNIDKQAKDGDLDILWKRGGEKIFQFVKNTTSYGPGFEHRASHSTVQAHVGNLFLIINSTKFSDEGDYQCLYNIPKESGTPDSVRLIVTGYPPQNHSVEAGGLLSIPLYTSDPVKIMFTRAGSGFKEVQMATASKGQATLGEVCRQRCAVVSQNNTLSVGSISPEDAGEYKVIDSKTSKTIVTVFLQVSAASAGLSAGAVVGIVVALLVLGVVCFVAWKYCPVVPRAHQSVAETEPASGTQLRQPDSKPLHAYDSEPSSPEPRTPVPETQPLQCTDDL
ncbi:hypothetical protein GJAV_G00248830 [Gymnothorax javanicus]|nr:hypothetical protein GJAV_G00248830 [Gymnothorax javanicus]